MGLFVRLHLHRGRCVGIVGELELIWGTHPHVSEYWNVVRLLSVRVRENWGCSQKTNWVLLRAPLFLGKWCEVITYFFIQKNKKKTKYKIHYQDTSLSLIE